MMGGLQISGTGCVARNFRGTAVRFGFALVGAGNKGFDVRIDGSSGDIVRVNGNDNEIRRLYGSDAVLIDGNHPDGAQLFGTFRPATNTYDLLKNIVLEDFAIEEWTKNVDNPLRVTNGPGQGAMGILQGIGMHNPPYQNITLNRVYVTTGLLNGVKIANVNGASLTDVVAVSAYHGTQYYDRRFPGIIVGGSNITSKNCRANQFPSAGVQAGVNGNAINDYSQDTKPDWAKAITAALQ